MKDNQNIYNKYLKGQASQQELEELFAALNDAKKMEDLEKLVYQTLADEYLQESPIGTRIASNQAQQIFALTKPVKRRIPLLHMLKYAAAILIFFLSTFWLYTNFYKDQSLLVKHDQQLELSATKLVDPALPTLELADGTIINLSKENLTNLKDYQLDTNSSQLATLKLLPQVQDTDAAPTYHTIRTPNGQKLMVDLPDGSRVNLSVGSSLKYPTTFIGQLDRTVELEGEAFFDIVKDNAKRAFKVISKGQEIQVLGTKFNVSAYAEDSFTRTTLLEGSVKVSTKYNTILIKPGQQAIVDVRKGGLSSKFVDTNQVLSWQDNYLVFDDMDVDQAVSLLSKWYAVRLIVDRASANDVRLKGRILFRKDIWQVLDILQRTGDISFAKQVDNTIKVCVK